MATLIKTDGTVTKIDPANGKDFKLKELQGYVNGSIEIINLMNGNVLVVNEDGKLKDKPNLKATCVAMHVLRKNDYISGDVVLCKQREIL